MLAAILEIAAGGGVAVGSGFVGNIMGFTRGRAERNIAALFVTGTADSLWCLCGHALSFHKGNGIGGCVDVERDKKGRVDFDEVGFKIHCQCQRFVGDPERNPPARAEAIEQARNVLDLDK